MAIGRVISNSVSSLFRSSSLRRFYSSSIPYHLQQVGFIGLGNMGSRMASNLIKAGYKVTVYDLNHSAMKFFSDKGILTKDSPSEVAEASDIVITMLPSSTHVLDVYNGPNGLLHNGNILRPWLFIDSSTIDPQTSRKLSEAVSACALEDKKDYWETPVMLDAPVSGGVLAADAGTLTFMHVIPGWRPRGSLSGCKALAPFYGKKHNLLWWSRKWFWQYTAFSPSKWQQVLAAKICNNLTMAVSMLGASEAFALGQSLGISASTLMKIMNSSSARCWSSDSYNPVPGVMEGVPSSRNYDGGFASKLMAKDLNLATTSAKEVGVRVPLASEAEQIFMGLCDEGHETKDFSCVFRHFYHGKDEL
ncbi:probable 3-hydroxyisobutyrate dehydrogenase, mitochondrial isoform X1 [Diospyros lotus]|uniref:probable 3-hydroxyisobutyrate dehydrogenase, mitochondrial isoform X1 n=3 Tax=Diospyros lotus TaxID=55363 RepID=UPI002251BBC4|nr:probable 3-hydroxyisobutyrate dehydrogenase, mitochondrial isoform X1 [Diospyros lotus]XP_052202004.1 probable 3-hydroxyisobutyrate dehydrogenase, mitochondrial isoform X1 [Diospyros lotus]